jgi:hypothetical protein
MVCRFGCAIIACFAFSGFAGVIVDDFNDAFTSQTTLGHNLKPEAHSGYWYGYNDLAGGVASTIDPDVIGADKQFTKAVVPGGPDATKCLHVTMNLNVKIDYPFAAIGFQINTQTPGRALPFIDLSAMTSVTFWAKGAGKLRVKFITDKVTAGYPVGDNWGDMGAEVTLTETWTQYTITPAQIKPQPSSPQAKDNLTWAACADKVTKMHFQTAPSMTEGVLDLYLDNVIMNGVTPQTFGGDFADPVLQSNRQAAKSGASVLASNGMITFSAGQQEKVAIDLYTPSGSLVKQIVGANVDRISMPAAMPTGYYLCKVTMKDEVVTVPMVVSR